MDDPAARFYQPRWFGVVFAILAAGAVFLLWESYRRTSQLRPIIAVVAIAIIAGTGIAGFMVNVNVARWIDPSGEIAELKNQLPPGTNLASFSPIEHRFAYYYGDPIAELDWPRSDADIPQGLTYFCFMRQPGDTAAVPRCRPRPNLVQDPRHAAVRMGRDHVRLRRASSLRRRAAANGRAWASRSTVEDGCLRCDSAADISRKAPPHASAPMVPCATVCGHHWRCTGNALYVATHACRFCTNFSATMS